jgi:protein-tyrosine phosphatase
MPTGVLFVCTANRCRSPMAEALLRRELAARGIDDVEVTSSGRLQADHPASEGAVRVMAARGIDLAAHRSGSTTKARVERADLVIGMAREHVREVVAAAPTAFPRTFTLRELVRRGEALGPRAAGQSLESWLVLLGAGRRAADLLGESAEDDIADPIGGPDAAYEATAGQLSDLVERLCALAFPTA